MWRYLFPRYVPLITVHNDKYRIFTILKFHLSPFVLEHLGTLLGVRDTERHLKYLRNSTRPCSQTTASSVNVTVVSTIWFVQLQRGRCCGPPSLPETPQTQLLTRTLSLQEILDVSLFCQYSPYERHMPREEISPHLTTHILVLMVK